MSMPGFTSEASLYRTTERQYSPPNDITEADGQVIIPRLQLASLSSEEAEKQLASFSNESQYGFHREVLRAHGCDRRISVPGDQNAAVLRPLKHTWIYRRGTVI
jgi:hypothetical protein